MPESPRRMDLRLTIPAEASFHPVAVDVAEKFAECAGAEPDAAQQFAADLRTSIASVADASRGDIAIQLSKNGRELVAVANAGSTSERTTCPLRD